METFAPQHGAYEKMKTPEEELAYLREQVRIKEKMLENPSSADRTVVAKEVVRNYADAHPKEVLHPEYVTPTRETEAIVLELTPEAHDATMSELLGIFQEKGFKNALTVVQKLKDPHITDDFERFLVQYLKAGFPVPGLKEKDPLYSALQVTLYEIALPEAGKDKAQKTLKELVSSMEQFYAGMLSVGDDASGTNAFALEIAVANHSDEFVFYVAVHDSKKALLEKHVLAIFHNARVTEKKDDYNIFAEGGVSKMSCAQSARKPIFSLKTYEQFDHDPLNILLNSFSKINKDGEGAAIQIIFKPCGDKYVSAYKKAIDKINKGVKVKEAISMPETTFDHVWALGKDIVKTLSEKKEEETVPVDQIAVEHIKNKISSPIVLANVRIVASAKDEGSANEIITNIESAFNQFDNPTGNRLKFARLTGNNLAHALHDFTFRIFDEDQKIPLSLKELTSMVHFPSTVMQGSPQLKISKASGSPAPIDLPQQGTLLGININRGIQTKAFLTAEDRLRHFYTIGQTGTGKTTILKNMIVQDILRGDGVCMIDPHGSDIQDILAHIPKERYEDVIYFDPGYTARPMGLNMLEYDVRYPEQKTFVVNEMLSIFNKLFDMKTAGGPMFEQYFRNAVLLVMENPESGNTLLDVSRVLAQKPYREQKLLQCKNPIVVQFWREVAEKAGGEASLANIVPYITSKFDVFLSNEIMRPIVAQEKSTFNFREIMDSRKILLVNLSKGRLGDINANLIGLILVGKILMAALSRVDSLGQKLAPFYLYIDEFQNVTTSSISTILSEARKYKLSLNIAHQFIAQLEEGIRDSVFGNVGSMSVFRVGADDAEYLEKQFSPVFTAKDLMNIENHHAYLKILANGQPIKPFDIETVPPLKGNIDNIQGLKDLSYLKYGRERAVVESEIMKKYEKPAPVAPTVPSTSSADSASRLAPRTQPQPIPSPAVTPPSPANSPQTPQKQVSAPPPNLPV